MNPGIYNVAEQSQFLRPQPIRQTNQPMLNSMPCAPKKVQNRRNSVAGSWSPNDLNRSQQHNPYSSISTQYMAQKQPSNVIMMSANDVIVDSSLADNQTMKTTRPRTRRMSFASEQTPTDSNSLIQSNMSSTRDAIGRNSLADNQTLKTTRLRSRRMSVTSDYTPSDFNSLNQSNVSSAHEAIARNSLAGYQTQQTTQPIKSRRLSVASEPTDFNVPNQLKKSMHFVNTRCFVVGFMFFMQTRIRFSVSANVWQVSPGQYPMLPPRAPPPPYQSPMRK